MPQSWNRVHILLNSPPETQEYSGRGGGEQRRPIRANWQQHGANISQQFTDAVQSAIELRLESTVEPIGQHGVYIEFESPPGFELAVESMSNGPAQIELCSVAAKDGNEDEPASESATVFIPDRSIPFFLQRFEKYASELTRFDKPPFGNLVDRIETVRRATLQALWTDPAERFPSDDSRRLWEVWLRHETQSEEIARFSDACEALGIRAPIRTLVLGDRTVVVVDADISQLGQVLMVSSDIAEIRGVSAASVPYGDITINVPQTVIDAWISSLAGLSGGLPYVAILDAGVTTSHPLLTSLLRSDDVHACEIAWETNGLGWGGHGTQMAGLSAFGNMRPHTATGSRLQIFNRLESVTIIPPESHEPTARDLWGTVSATAVALVESKDSTRRRVFFSAVNSAESSVGGAPTSWSASIDALSFGHQIDVQSGELVFLNERPSPPRLFILAAGNVDTTLFFNTADPDHLAISDLEGIREPAQSWNALTVGAATFLTPEDEGWNAISQPGELSPYSSTSVTFDSQWPVKPEVLAEGGNGRVNEAGDHDFGLPQDSLLSTHHKPESRLFSPTYATSAASAQVARMAARVAKEYPAYLPQTVRGLIVHTAEWSDEMASHFAAARNLTAKGQLLRRYGYGVVDEERLIRSSDSHVTMVVQESIRPFEKGKLREIQFFSLPWPHGVLDELGDTQVRMRVTLSYFVEPNAGRRGWRQRYSYASHGLRFEIRLPGESKDAFQKRLNISALAEDEVRPTRPNAASRWLLGPVARNKGSIHSDHWIGPASELMPANEIAVYPISGWWKDQKNRDRSAIGAQYALIVSIDSGDSELNVWTPVATDVGWPVTEFSSERD